MHKELGLAQKEMGIEEIEYLQK